VTVGIRSFFHMYTYDILAPMFRDEEPM